MGTSRETSATVGHGEGCKQDSYICVEVAAVQNIMRWQHLTSSLGFCVDAVVQIR